MIKRIVSVSGGKDSTALYLWAIEQWGKDGFRAVFADTGNEHPVTYNYVRNLHLMAGGPKVDFVCADFRKDVQRIFENVDKSNSEHVKARVARNHYLKTVGFTTGNVFLDMMIAKGAIPRANRQFCTKELKMDPIKKWLEGWRQDSDTIEMYVGIRAEESEKRAKMAEQEWSDFYNCDFFRPLLRWKIDQVWKLLEKYEVPPNPLYNAGEYKRVGCFPCIHITKSEIATLPDWVWGKLQHWETVLGDSWFVYKGGETTPSLQQVREWARTSRGGKQFAMFPAESRDVPSCMSTWGVCE
jgi:3'-phosphoadenosine 5'-phosphosulfate sulfotransferase (PAPS reductase)/FAD synthetase